MQKKNVILGLIKGYDFEVLGPFVETLKATDYAGDLVLFYSDIDEASVKKLRAIGAILVPFTLIYPYQKNHTLPTRWQGNKQLQNLSAYTVRYLVIYWYLEKHASEYQNAMFTDVRDVIFQKDPFDFSIDGKLCSFIERTGISINDSPINRDWVVKAFGESMLDVLGSKPISCGGVLIGPVHAMQNYVTKVLDTIVEFDITADALGIDQPIHNYLMQAGQIADVMLYSNDTGPVLTLGLEDQVYTGPKRLLVQKNGHVPNVVHQYDRHQRIAKRYYSPALRYRLTVERWRGRAARILKPFPALHRTLLRIRDAITRS